MPRTAKQFENIREERKHQISEVAIKLFAENGYHATSISQISKNANISKGLMYNYFKSKEELLSAIFLQLIENTMNHINPKGNNTIDDSEAESFFDGLIDMAVENPTEWKLFYQLIFQQEVMDLMMKEFMSEKYQQNIKVMFNYFADREFDDVELAIMHFGSLYKGFILAYVFAPELFPVKAISKFKMLLKELFVKPTRKDKSKTVEYNDFLAYMIS